MPGTHPSIERPGAVSVVCLEMLVLEVVGIGMCIHRGRVAIFDLVKSNMPNHGPVSADLEVIENEGLIEL